MTATPVETSPAKDGIGATPDAEKDNPTTVHHGGHAVMPIDAPVYGAVGLVGEPEEKAEHAASAFKNHPVESTTSIKHEHDGSTTTNEKLTTPNDEAVTVADDEEPDDTVYPGGLPLALLTFGLCMATFVVALDNTIIATAIPRITTVFNSLGDVGWYGSSYLLTTTALQPSFGRIYTVFNVKYTYVFALVLFEVGSVLCAAATNSTMLIIGRAVAGAGASAIFSGGMTIVGYTVPLRKRPIYLAALSSMFGISSVIGPLLGGAFTDSKATWRWCFWINLPFGAIAVAAVWFFFQTPTREDSKLTLKEKILEIDLLGALFLICAIVCLLLALQWGGFKYPWKDSKVWGLLIGFAGLITLFILQQFRRGERATIPPRIFGQRTVLWASLYTCFLNMSLYTHIFYLPFFFQAIKGTTAEGSGIRSIPYLASIIVASIIVGGGVTIIGWYKPFMIVGAIIFTVGAGMIYSLRVNSGAGMWVGYQILAGLGAGAGIQVPFIAIQVVLSSKDMPTGNAIAIFFNSLGGSISISIAQNIFVNGLSTNIPKFSSVSPLLVVNAGATHLREKISANDLPGVLLGYMLSINQAFVLPIATGGLAIFFAIMTENKTVKGKKLAPTTA